MNHDSSAAVVEERIRAAAPCGWRIVIAPIITQDSPRLATLTSPKPPEAPKSTAVSQCYRSFHMFFISSVSLILARDNLEQGGSKEVFGRATVRVNLRGRMSIFGGPEDMGVRTDEGLALVSNADLRELRAYFLPEQPPGTTGLARRLNPNSIYIACRWNYRVTAKVTLVASLVTVGNPQNQRQAFAKPVDWGPDAVTGRIADLWPGLASNLGLETDNEVEVTLE